MSNIRISPQKFMEFMLRNYWKSLEAHKQGSSFDYWCEYNGLLEDE